MHQHKQRPWVLVGVAAFVSLVIAAGTPSSGGCGGGVDDEGAHGNTKLAIAAEYTVVRMAIPPRVAPGGSVTATIDLKNTTTATWAAGSKLVLVGDGQWTGGTLTAAASTKPGKVGSFTGTLGASTQIGRYPLHFQLTVGGAPVGPPIDGKIEVTCSDGIFCNGDERWANGKCVAGPLPCDDGESCTTDTCDETSGTCKHTLGANCAACAAKNCNPKCPRGVQCGDDGCGSVCGYCDPGKSCVDGKCAVVTQLGSCGNPIPLLAPGEALLGQHSTTGDTSDGFNEVVPTCNSTSTAKEKIYSFTISATDGNVGIDARSFGIDTVLHLRKACLDDSTTVGCTDDSAPPGNYGSRVAALLSPGTYYLIVDGFDGSSIGPYTLTTRFSANCVPQCDGRFCGNTDGCGGDCGICPTGQECNGAGRCVKSPCTPDCNGRKCGDDGCGGSCGDCHKGQLCLTETGQCHDFAACDHDRPVCKTACSSQEYCGTDCACHRVREPRPDLVVSKDRLANEILFETREFSPASCAVAEQCVGGTGPRKLLRFSVEAVNQGQATATVPPPAQRPDLFTWSPCHGHFHFNGFASYALTDAAGNVVRVGQKLAYCMEDTVQVDKGPGVQCEKKYDCSVQGIQKGWSDLYGNALDCQWLDVTGVAPGNYFLSVTVNPNRAFEEASFDNNTTTVPVVVP